MRQGKKLIKIIFIITSEIQFEEGQQRIRCINMKRGLEVLEDKLMSTLRRRYERWLKGDDIAQGIVSRCMLFEWVIDFTVQKSKISGRYDEFESLFETL
jgi:hypothetical protein